MCELYAACTVCRSHKFEFTYARAPFETVLELFVKYPLFSSSREIQECVDDRVSPHHFFFSCSSRLFFIRFFSLAKGNQRVCGYSYKPSWFLLRSRIFSPFFPWPKGTKECADICTSPRDFFYGFFTRFFPSQREPKNVWIFYMPSRILSRFMAFF